MESFYQIAVRNFACLRPPRPIQSSKSGNKWKSGIQFHDNYPGTCAVRSPHAHDTPPSCMVAYAPRFAHWYGRFLCRLGYSSSPANLGHGHSVIGWQEKRRGARWAPLPIRLRYVAYVLQSGRAPHP